MLDALEPPQRAGLVALEFCRPPTMARLEEILESAHRDGSHVAVRVYHEAAKGT